MGSRATDHRQRQALRRRWELQGLPDDVIAQRLAVKRGEQAAKRAAVEALLESARLEQRREAAQRRARAEAQAAELDRLHVDPAEAEEDTYRRLALDARGFAPARVDGVTVGAGRVTGLSAAAARRGRTFTKWQHDERTGPTAS